MKGEIIMTIKIEDNIPMRFKLNNIGEPKREFWNSYKHRCPIYKEIERFIKARVGKNN